VDASLARPSVWGQATIDVRSRLHHIAAHFSETTVQIEKILGDGAFGMEARNTIRHCARIRGFHERSSAAGSCAELDGAYRELASWAS